MLNRFIIKKFIDSRKVNSFQEFIEKHDNNGQTISSAQRDEIFSDYLLNENVISKFYQDKDTQKQGEIFELFNNNIIQNRELFWILFGFVFNNLNFSIRNDEQIRNIFEYRNRLDGLLRDRNLQANYICSKLVGLPLKQYLLPLNRILNKEKLIVYKGFLVPKDDDIRNGRYVIGNREKNSQQDIGIGFSFTLDRKIAIAIANRIPSSRFLLYSLSKILDIKKLDWGMYDAHYGFKSWKVFFQNYLIDWEDLKIIKELRRKSPKKRNSPKSEKIISNYVDALLEDFSKVSISESIHEKKQEFVENSYIGIDVRPCVAKYEIDRDKIIVCFNLRGQKEIICYPEDAKLIRYDFVNFQECLNNYDSMEKNWENLLST